MLTFTFSSPQRRAMLKTAAGFFAFGCALTVLGEVLVHRVIARAAALMILVPVVFLIQYGLSSRNRTVLDRYGVHSDGFIRSRVCTWGDVASIDTSVKKTGAGVIRLVQVRLHSGKKFNLGAPMTAGAYPDPDFDAKVAQIEAFWRAEVAAIDSPVSWTSDLADPGTRPLPAVGKLGFTPLLARRSGRIWARIAAGLGLLLAAFMWLAAVGTAQDNLAVRHAIRQGTSEPALIQQVLPGHPTTYQLSMEWPVDGTPVSFDDVTQYVDSSAHLGDTIRVMYDPDASAWKDVRLLDVPNWWRGPLIMTVVGVGFAAGSVHLLLRCRRFANRRALWAINVPEPARSKD